MTPTLRYSKSMLLQVCLTSLFLASVTQQQCLCLIFPKDDNAAKFIAARELVCQVSSPTSFKQASELLEECTRQGHEHCPKMQSLETTLPTRVIDCLDTTRPKIHITHGSEGTYAVLSYVWGEDQRHKARTDNIAAYVREIELTLLPQTIRDAIVTTERLGLRYLWVDSLCILQDSEEDKGYEIGQMRKIYKDAYVTIIAACAQKASQGFLQDRPAPPPAISLPFWCPDRDIGIMSLRSGMVEPSEPVDTRGWCFQERLARVSFTFVCF
jgi:Heterokaryon incompatibility protein (HET)